MHIPRPNFEKRGGGLITVIAQDYKTKQVLMLAYTDEAGYKESVETGFAVYYSTSRQKRWKKGEESGNTQILKSILIDCDLDAVIFLVDQQGSCACHTEAESCFFLDGISGKNIMNVPKLSHDESFREMEVTSISVPEQNKTA